MCGNNYNSFLSRDKKKCMKLKKKMIIIKYSLFIFLRIILGGKSFENIFCYVNY